jgi:hypothetical protein
VKADEVVLQGYASLATAVKPEVFTACKLGPPVTGTDKSLASNLPFDIILFANLKAFDIAILS